MALTQYLLLQLYILDWRPYPPIERVNTKEFLKETTWLEMSNQQDTDSDADLCIQLMFFFSCIKN